MTGLADGVVDEHVRYDKRHPLLTTPMSAASRLDHLTCRRPPAHLYQPQKPHRVQPSRSSSQPASQPVNQINQLAGCTASHHPVASPHHGGCPPSGCPVSLCPCRPGRAEVRQPPACSRSEIQFPPLPTERDAPRKQNPRHGRRRRVRADVTKHLTCQRPPPRANITRVCAGPGP